MRADPGLAGDGFGAVRALPSASPPGDEPQEPFRPGAVTGSGETGVAVVRQLSGLAGDRAALLAGDVPAQSGRLAKDLVLTVVHGPVHRVPRETDSPTRMASRPLRTCVLDLPGRAHDALVTSVPGH